MTRITPHLLVVLLVGCIGCSGGAEGPETAEVVGLVSLDGAPLAGADVFFHPYGGDGNLQACQAVTDADGRFTVSTHIGTGKYKAGMIPGEYRVSISKLDTSNVTSAFTPPKNTLPGKYASPDTSGFTVTVLSDQENEFTFPLQSDRG